MSQGNAGKPYNDVFSSDQSNRHVARGAKKTYNDVFTKPDSLEKYLFGFVCSHIVILLNVSFLKAIHPPNKSAIVRG